MNLTKEDITAFFDRHPEIAREVDNFRIAIEWAIKRDLQPTEANLDIAFQQCREQFEPRFPTDEEIAGMTSEQLKPFVERQWRKEHPPQSTPSAVPFGVKYVSWLHNQ